MKLIAISCRKNIRSLSICEKAPGIQDALTYIYLLSHKHGHKAGTQPMFYAISNTLLNLNVRIATRFSRQKKLKEAFNVFRYLTEAKTLACKGYTIYITDIP